MEFLYLKKRCDEQKENIQTRTYVYLINKLCYMGTFVFSWAAKWNQSFLKEMHKTIVYTNFNYNYKMYVYKWVLEFATSI